MISGSPGLFAKSGDSESKGIQVKSDVKAGGLPIDAIDIGGIELNHNQTLAADA